MTDLTMLFIREMWKTLRLWSRKEAEKFKQGLMGHAGRRMESCWAESNVNCDRLKRFQKGKILVSGLQIIFLIFGQKM